MVALIKPSVVESSMALTHFEQNVVNNLRTGEAGHLLTDFTDEQISKGWKEFSGSAEYPDMTKFPDWCGSPDVGPA